MYRRTIYAIAIVCVVALGVASRAFEVGHVVWDKYLGDALYAVLIYLILRWFFPDHRTWWHAVAAALLCLAIECFQLTGIPMAMRNSGNVAAYWLSVALGAVFGFWDLIAYGVGLVATCLLDRSSRNRTFSA